MWKELGRPPSDAQLQDHTTRGLTPAPSAAPPASPTPSGSAPPMLAVGGRGSISQDGFPVAAVTTEIHFEKSVLIKPQP